MYSHILLCRVHLRHRRKHKSHAHSISRVNRGKFNKALFSTYICRGCVTVCKTNPIHDGTLILGGFMVLRSQRRNKQMILTRDTSLYFLLLLLFFSSWNTEASKPGRGNRTSRQPTSLYNKLVVLHVDVTGTDLKMKLRSSCSRWGRLAFKPLKPPPQLGSETWRNLSK